MKHKSKISCKLAFSLLILSSIFICGCASRADVGRHNSRYQQPLNQVVFLDKSLGARIAVDDIGSNRTGSNTLEAWAKLRNLSRRRDYNLAIRTHFYDEMGTELEVTEWQLFYISKLGTQTYKTQSINRDLDSYYIEVMEVEQSEYAQKPHKNKPSKSTQTTSGIQNGEFMRGQGKDFTLSPKIEKWSDHFSQMIILSGTQAPQ